MPKIVLFFLFLVQITTVLNAQTILKGTVIQDSTMEPLSFISVGLKGSFIGTRTDSNGHFILNITQGAGDLVFSFLGFETKTISFPSGEYDALTSIFLSWVRRFLGAP